jgi:hypothetical protein
MRAGRPRGRVVLVGLVALALVAYRSMVIWCRRFTCAFGAAELAPTR